MSDTPPGGTPPSEGGAPAAEPTPPEAPASSGSPKPPRASRARRDRRRPAAAAASPAPDNDPAPRADTGGGGDVDGGGDDTEPEGDPPNVWVIVVDAAGVPWGGAVVQDTPRALTLAIPALPDNEGQERPSTWVQFRQAGIRRVQESNELEACSVALLRQSDLTHTTFGVSHADMASLRARLLPKPTEAPAATEEGAPT